MKIQLHLVEISWCLFEKLKCEGSYYPCPISLIDSLRCRSSFVSDENFSSEDMKTITMKNYAVLVNECPKRVLHLQPKSFVDILLVPRLYQDTYVKFASEMSKVEPVVIEAALDEGRICGRSLIKTMRATMYEGLQLCGEDTCLRYLLRVSARSAAMQQPRS